MTSFARITTPAAALLLIFTFALQSVAQVTVTLGERAPEPPKFGPVDETRVVSELRRVAHEAQTSGRAPEGMGFYRPGDHQVPKALGPLAESVFRIVVPNGRALDSKTIFGSRSYAAILKLLAKMPDRDGVGPLEREVFGYQIKECERTKPERCVVFEGVSDATAFVTGDGRELRTAAHVTRAVRMLNPLPIFLVDGRGKILFTPAQLNARVISEPARPAHSQSVTLDQVIVRTASPVARPLELAAHAPNAGEPVYIVGVPRATTDRGRFQANNAEGTGVAISRGVVLDLAGLIERFARAGLKVEPSAAEATLADALAMTADAGPRSPGSAVVNARGEVVGLYSARDPSSGAVFPFAVSYATKYLLKPDPAPDGAATAP